MMRNVVSMTAIAICLAACGPAAGPATDSTRSTDRVQPVQHPDKAEVSPEKVEADVVGRVVRVSELTGGAETEWTFDAEEFRHVDVLQRQDTAGGQALVVFMTTRNAPAAGEDQVQVSGKLQLQYERRAGKWFLTRIENLSFRYTVGVGT